MSIEARTGGDIIESVIIQGDLGKLTPEQRTTYYAKVCDSLGLNPYTKPFDYIRLNGALTLYARRDAADQLRKIHGVSLTIVSREKVDDLYIVTARATDAEGRSDESTGVVSLAGLKGDALANALMKAETKAKRRVTLSLVGLGWLDETEVETIPDARIIEPDAPAQIEAPGDGGSSEETATRGEPQRPWEVDYLKATVARTIAHRVSKGVWKEAAADAKVRSATVMRIGELFPNDNKDSVDMKRHALLYGLFGKRSTTALTDAECRAVLSWATEKVDETTWAITPAAIIEADRIVNAVDEEQGQQRLFNEALDAEFASVD